jgi:hypothetical protein
VKNNYERQSNCAIRRNCDGVFELLHMGSSLRIYQIDSVGAFVWQQLDGKTSPDQIAKRMVRQFKVAEARAKRDLNKFLQQMKKQKLISPAQESPPC